MHAPILGFGIAILATLVLVGLWLLRRARGQASSDPFERDQGFGSNRRRTLGPSEPGSWQPNSDGRW